MVKSASKNKSEVVKEIISSIESEKVGEI